MIPNALLLDDSCNVRKLVRIERKKYHAVVCLFWPSPETRQLISDAFEGTCCSPGDIVERVDLIEKELTEYVQRICDGGPKYGGLAFRRYLSEELYRSWLYPRICASTLKFLEELRSDLKVEQLEVDVIASDQAWNILERLALSSCRNGCLSLIPHAHRSKMYLKKPFQIGLIKKILRQLRGAQISGQWRAQVWNLIENVDKDHGKRCSLNRFRRPTKISPGMITFFSSYLNNSRILQSFRPLMPGPVHWIFTNYYARKPISNEVMPVSWIWEFGSRRNQENDFRDDTILSDCERASSQNGTSGTSLPESKILQNWNNGQLRSLANLTFCWKNYLEDVKPRLIVMANQWGIEGWFTEIARHHGIPVMQVMHGVLGGYFYTGTPIISDAMVVPGAFWQDLWPEREREKILVFNPMNYITNVERDRKRGGRTLTYFSWPLMNSTFYNFLELTDGFIEIFQRLLIEKKCEVLVRCHPLENPADFVRRWEVLHGHLPMGIRISKHEPLDCVLAKTDVALMFRSTTMLNCMASEIPILMPGWIDLGWNQALRSVPGIYLASDFSDLENRIKEWLDQSPEIPKETFEYFVQSPEQGRDAFCSLVEDLIAGQRAGRKVIL